MQIKSQVLRACITESCSLLPLLPSSLLLLHWDGWRCHLHLTWFSTKLARFPSCGSPAPSSLSSFATLLMMLQSMPSHLLRQQVILPPVPQSWVLASVLFSCKYEARLHICPFYGVLPTDSILLKHTWGKAAHMPPPRVLSIDSAFHLKHASSLSLKPGQLVSVHYDNQILDAKFKEKNQKAVKNNDRNS